MDSITKKCVKCGVEKNLSDFNVAPLGKDGFRTDCKACQKERNRLWRIEHKDIQEACRASWKERHPTYNIDYYIANKEAVTERNKQWRKSRPDKVTEYNHKRRSRINENGGVITEKEWLDILEKFEYKCVCCGVDNQKLTLDHIVPISRGGANVADNVQPLCGTCNRKKGTKTIDYREKQRK